MRRNPNRKKRPSPIFLWQRGVTLIELVMAIVILALIGIPMGFMIKEQVEGMMASTDFTTAGNLARFEMEKLNNVPNPSQFDSIMSGSSSYPGYAYDVNRTVVTTTGSGGAVLKDITITVNRTGNPTAIVTLFCSIAKNVTYST